jgi:hypothetical protein
VKELKRSPSAPEVKTASSYRSIRKISFPAEKGLRGGFSLSEEAERLLLR